MKASSAATTVQRGSGKAEIEIRQKYFDGARSSANFSAYRSRAAVFTPRLKPFPPFSTA
jgi:hypothetical protein